MAKFFSYPVLSDRDYIWFRIGGPGLANCLFFAAKAYVYAKAHGAEYIEPTWRKFSIGPWLRKERDKRVYNNLFKPIGINGIRKAFLISVFNPNKDKIISFSTLGNYFGDINGHIELINDFFQNIILPSTIEKVNEKELNDTVAVHVRLGDYLQQLRIPINWYVGIIRNILLINPSQEIVVFSDGTDEELMPLLNLRNVRRVFYGNAFADMWAMSKCKLVIASDSTFSAWGAFMGQKPIIFSKRHFPPVYNGDVSEYVLGDETELPEEMKKLFK